MHNPLSNDGRLVVYGSMMGDGFLNYGRHRHACFATSASEAHSDYMAWKYDYLKPIMLMEPQRFLSSLNGKVFPTYCLWTRRHSFFTRLRHSLYPEGKRIVKESLLNRLDDLGLAVWFMDDGQLVINYDKHTKKPRGRYVTMNIQRYSPHDCDIIKRWFLERLDIRSRLQYDVSCDISSGKRLKLCIGAVDAYHKLRPRIESYVMQVPSMHHKLDFKYVNGKEPPQVWSRYYKPSHSAQQVLEDYAEGRDSRCP